MSSSLVLVGYQMNIDELTKKLYEENPLIYRLELIALRIFYLEIKGMYMTKKNKPNNKGTKVTWKLIENEEEYDRAYSKLQADMEDLKKIGEQMKNNKIML